MKALVVEAPYQAVIKEVPYPEPRYGEVTIEVVNVGICGTDVHIFKGEFLSPYPIIPGHEFSGVVHEIGEGVEGFAVGDRVTADPSLFCGHCSYCNTKRGNQCEHWGALGNTVDGSMAEYVRVPAKNVVKLPDSMTFAEGAFVEPMACVVHAMNRLEVQAGDRAILFGAGAMGQQLIQTLVHSGVSELAVVDISPLKLEQAAKRGATHCIVGDPAELNAAKLTFADGFDIVVDATGVPSVIEQALGFMGRTAKYLQFGVTPKEAAIQVSPFQLYNRDWTLIGSMAINYTFLPAYHWIRSKRIDVASLVSRIISLEETLAYLQGAREPDDLKVQIRVK